MKNWTVEIVLTSGYGYEQRTITGYIEITASKIEEESSDVLLVDGVRMKFGKGELGFFWEN